MYEKSAETFFHENIFKPSLRDNKLPPDIENHLKTVKEIIKLEGENIKEDDWKKDVKELMENGERKIKSCLDKLSLYTTNIQTLQLKELVDEDEKNREIIRDKKAIVLLAPTGKKKKKIKF